MISRFDSHKRIQIESRLFSCSTGSNVINFLKKHSPNQSYLINSKEGWSGLRLDTQVTSREPCKRHVVVRVEVRIVVCVVVPIVPRVDRIRYSISIKDGN